VIFGVGTDIVQISRIKAATERHGESFAQRILADTEFELYKKASRPDAYLAKRFAAKEAAAKAMGTGFTNGLSLQHIIVTNAASGQPQLELVGRAKKLGEELGFEQSFLSLADEKEYAIAYVTLMVSPLASSADCQI